MSASFGTPSVKIMFDGLISRWAKPCVCNASSASVNDAPSRIESSADNRCCRARSHATFRDRGWEGLEPTLRWRRFYISLGREAIALAAAQRLAAGFFQRFDFLFQDRANPMPCQINLPNAHPQLLGHFLGRPF